MIISILETCQSAVLIIHSNGSGSIACH